MLEKKLRTRMAPSPTGNFNIGGAFGTLMVWLLARHNNGTFVLRFEDTDKERSKREYEDNILQWMKWLGLEPDEIYRQSENLKTHQKYLKQLLNEGKAFWCYHSKEELETEQKQQQADKEAPRHICSYKSDKEKGNKEGGIIRLNVNEDSDRTLTFNDALRGEISFAQSLMGDFSIARSLESPLYLFANAVDDYEQGITHIIRGDDGISNVPRQMLIQEALGFDKISFVHYPMMLGEDKKKLSKRKGALPISEYRTMGYLPEAIINYLAAMGFTADESEEIFDIQELTKRFDLTKLHKSPSVLDHKKLGWFNEQYLKKMSDQDLFEMLRNRIVDTYGDQSDEYMLSAIPLMRERMTKLSDVGEFGYFFEEPQYDAELLKWKKKPIEDAAQALKQVRDIIAADMSDEAKLREQLDELGTRLQDRGVVYWPLRAALTGVKFSPDPVDIAMVLGTEIVLKRIDAALLKLG